MLDPKGVLREFLFHLGIFGGKQPKKEFGKRLWWSPEVREKLIVRAGPVSQSHSTVNVLRPKSARSTLIVSLLIATRENAHHEELWDFSIKGC